MPKNKDQPPDDEDTLIFREAVADVRPITPDKRIQPVIKKPSPRPRAADFNGEIEIENTMSDPADIRDVKIDDVLFFVRSGIQNNVQRKLRRGEFPVENELDLHGYTVAEAKRAVNEFFLECTIKHHRCIRIIHGKGYRSESKIPILKTYVAYWLKQRHDVLAYTSARPDDGGTGALYVLLKVVR